MLPLLAIYHRGWRGDVTPHLPWLESAVENLALLATLVALKHPLHAYHRTEGVLSALAAVPASSPLLRIQRSGVYERCSARYSFGNLHCKTTAVVMVPRPAPPSRAREKAFASGAKTPPPIIPLTTQRGVFQPFLNGFESRESDPAFRVGFGLKYCSNGTRLFLLLTRRIAAAAELVP